MITNKFNYPELKRLNNDLGRFYIDPQNNHVPSVTTVLNNISDKKTSIDQWRKRVGDIEADRVMKEATDIGSMVHLSLENYLNNEDHNVFSQDGIGIMAEGMSNKLINDSLKDISEVYGLEVHLVLNDLYAGTADCVGILDGEETIIDFKTSKRIKKKEWIDDYCIQLAAYTMAHNYVHRTGISKGVIMMCSKDNFYQEFIIQGLEMKKYMHMFLKRIDEYYEEQKGKD